MKYLCEYLSRINSLSVCLESESDVETILIANKTITVEAGDTTAVIPAGVELANHTLRPAKPEVAIRVPTAKSYTPHNWQFNVPWQAKDLMGKEIKCRACNAKLPPAKQYKQLPSEYWAELMEFWHCHKPEETQAHTKDYNISFDPAVGHPLVADTYLKVHPSDIPCHHFDPEKVWKWQLSVNDTNIESHVFMAAMLRELVNSHAIFSFLLEDKKTSVLVWIFNIQSQYTLTGSFLQSGLKVYYSTDKSQFPALMEQRGEIETVSMPSTALEELIKELDSTNALIPSNLQTLNGFKLGFISET